MKIERSLGTHNGTFHADEVTAAALLILFDLIDKDKIHRTRDPEVLAKCEYVCDVGGIFDPSKKLFDHHQADYIGSLSSAGMILEYLRDQHYMTSGDYSLLQQSLVAGVDAHDNGVDLTPSGVSTYSNIIGNFTPISYEASSEEQDEAFFRALDFSLGHLTRMRERHDYIHSCKEIVSQAMKTYKDCLIFDKALPWMDSFFELQGEDHSANFVIMPSGLHWKLRGIPPNLSKKMKVRHPLPLSWAGLLGQDLVDATGIEGALFCHKGRFISVWKTKEDAIHALELMLKMEKQH